jgi:hypothetical protein
MRFFRKIYKNAVAYAMLDAYSKGNFLLLKLRMRNLNIELAQISAS